MSRSPVPDEAVVHLDAPELGPLQPIGAVRRAGLRSRSAISFAYRQAWLDQRNAFSIDPVLALAPGDQYAGGGLLPGALSDCAPDRWGRTLLERREAVRARREDRKPRSLDDWDFLLGVSDAVRMGALRLSDDDGNCLDASAPDVPPKARLRELKAAARRAELGEPIQDENDWLDLLIAPGSSLGGARPKANFVDEDGSLWIAKFPSQTDRHDVGAWEYLLARIARRARILTSDSRLLKLGKKERTFATRRFDRDGPSRRLYVSAMTLARKRDGEEASYLDLVQAITDHGAPAAINADLEQLFRRLVFNVVFCNRDDHLRNHGFVRTTEGWRLAPAFDLNPTAATPEHSLAIDESVHQPDLAVVRETAPFYRLSPERADAIVDEVVLMGATWRHVATEIGLAADETALVAREFQV